MSAEIVNWYEPIRTDHRRTRKVQVKIPSLGTYDGLRVPDLLLTALYHINPNTGNLERNVKLLFQTDGRSEAQLNFKHDFLSDDYTFRIYNFDVNMDVLFGEGVINKFGGTVGGNIGSDKGVKGGIQGGLEASQESPGATTTLHGRVVGFLNAKEGKIEVSGGLV